jgi:hypothetical protein
MKTIIIALLLAGCATARAQEVIWEQHFNGSPGIHAGGDVIPAPDGGYVASGQTKTGDAETIYLVHTEENGTLRWERNLSDYDSTIAVALFTAGDGGYYLVGSTQRGEGGDTTYHPWIAKVDQLGNVVWEKKAGNGRVNGADRTNDGGFILTGSIGNNLLITKLDSTGALDWQRGISRRFLAVGASVRQTADGGYIVAGTNVGIPTSDGDVLVVRLSSTGVERASWALPMRFVGWEDGYCVEEVDGGDIVVAGISRNSALATDRFGMLTVMRLDTSSRVEWFYPYAIYTSGNDSGSINRPYMSRNLGNGKIVICGAAGPDLTMPFMLQIGPNGAIEWQKIYGPLIFSESAASAFRPLPDGGFIAAGVKSGQLLVMRLANPTSGVEERRGAMPDKMWLSNNQLLPSRR